MSTRLTSLPPKFSTQIEPAPAATPQGWRPTRTGVPAWFTAGSTDCSVPSV
jgi:hypothetical protein